MKNGNGHARGIAFVVVSVVLSACAQLLMKVGMLELHGVNWQAALHGPLTGLPILLPALSWVFAGIGCYVASMFFWMAALARYELSLAYPVLSMSYVLVYIAAVAWPRLGESVSLSKTIGIVLIVTGVVLVTRVNAGRASPRK